MRMGQRGVAASCFKGAGEDETQAGLSVFCLSEATTWMTSEHLMGLYCCALQGCANEILSNALWHFKLLFWVLLHCFAALVS